MAEDKPLKPVPLGLTGKWRPAHDGTQLADGDFQTLTNMRYTDAPGIKSISGMTKINTTPLTYPKIKSGYHFRKEQPEENHVLVQSFNSAVTASEVYDNKTAIATVGDFSTTSVWSDTSGAGTGRFSAVPDGCVGYANGKETCVWGGDEFRVASFLVGDVNGDNTQDFTPQVNNTLTDSLNVATLATASAEPIDAVTVSLLHFNNNITDSSTAYSHTWTNTDVTFDASNKKFGTRSGSFNGSTSVASVADSVEFDFSGGAWCVDFWIKPTNYDEATIFYKETDSDNWMAINKSVSGVAGAERHTFILYIFKDGVSEITLMGSELTHGEFGSAFFHVEVEESGDYYYIFLNGNLRGYANTSARPDVYTGTLQIGGALSYWFLGKIDELRISQVVRHTSNFDVQISEYGTASGLSYLYIGSIRPIAGINYYLGNINTNVATQAGYYWSGSAWTSVGSPTDGTILTATKTMTKTGSLSFASTVSTAKPKVIDNQYLYWYQIVFSGISAGVTVSYCTLNVPFQSFIDLWDGTPRGVQAYFPNATGAYRDETTNVFTKDYNEDGKTTYSSLNNMLTTMHIVIGFAERATAIEFGIVPNGGNINPAVMTISYWSGSAWVSVGAIEDKTSVGGVSFAQPGWVSWNPPTEVEESVKSIISSPPWYFYKVQFNAALSALVRMDYVFSIPVQQTIRPYSFICNWQNRPVLISEVAGQKNRIMIGGFGSSCVFNGQNSLMIDKLGNNSAATAAGALFTRYTGSFYDTLLICKKDEVWVLDGTDVQNYHLYKVSDIYGCVAPETFKVFPVSYSMAPGIARHVAIWQSAVGIVMFDGNTLGRIDDDIHNYFDLTKPECISSTLLNKSIAWTDEREAEYCWSFASGSSATGLNTELHYSVMKKGWYKVDRVTANNSVQCGIPVHDTLGGAYTYGGLSTGYLERLEYGNTFDLSDITSTFKIKDSSVGWIQEFEERWVKLIAKAKSGSTATAILTAFLDGNLTAENKTLSLSLASSTRRIVQSTQSCSWGPAAFISIQGQVVSNDVAVAFEPIGIGLEVKQIRDDTRPLVS